jgi:hypothetical protein
MIDALNKALSSASEFGSAASSLASNMLPPFGELLKAAGNDPKFTREVSRGLLSVCVDLYAAAQDHRKRVRAIEDKLESILKNAVRNFPRSA